MGPLSFWGHWRMLKKSTTTSLNDLKIAPQLELVVYLQLFLVLDFYGFTDVTLKVLAFAGPFYFIVLFALT